MATTYTTGQNPLFDLQKPYIERSFRDLEDVYQQGDVGPYSGPRVAEFDPVRAQAVNQAITAAQGPQQQLADAYTKGILGIAGGTDEYTNRLAQQAGSAAGAGFSGTFGGARHANAATGAAADQIAGRQLAALGMIPDAQAAALTPATTLGQAGQTLQGYNQSLIDADRALYEEQRNAPYNWIRQFQTGLGVPGVSAPSNQVVQNKPSGFDKLLGLGSLAGGIGKLFFAEGGKVPGYAGGGMTLEQEEMLYPDI